MHWKLLGLDRETANKSEVKKAYAKLLRQHRPDEDPEMFQKVRQAFEQANRDLASPSGTSGSTTPIVGFGEIESDHDATHDGFPTASTTASASPFSTPTYTPPDFEPAEFGTWQEDLMQALNDDSPAAIQDALCAMHQHASQRPQCWGACAQLLKSLDSDARARFAQQLPIPYLLDELQTGQRDLSSDLIQYWSEQQAFDSLNSFGQQVLVTEGSIHGPDFGMIAAQLATLLAIVAHPLATQLSHMAYGHLDRHQRDRVMQETEFWLQIGLLVQYQGPEFAQFWETRIRQPRLDETDWKDSHSLTMLNQLGLTARHTPEPFEIMRRYIPPVLWSQFEHPEPVEPLPIEAWQPERPIADQVWDQISSEQPSAPIKSTPSRSSTNQTQTLKVRTSSRKNQGSRRSHRSSRSRHSYDDGEDSSKKIMWIAGAAFIFILKIIFFVLRDSSY